MRRLFILFVISGCLLLAMADQSFAFPQDGQNCSKCHKLNKEEASKTLSVMIPDLRVLDVRPSAVKGLWEIDFESGGRKAVVYLDYSGKHLMAGNLFAIDSKRNITQERIQEISKIDVSKIPLDDALLMGEKDAKYKVIVFDDPD